MSRGFTLIELVMTVIVLSILSAFTFSVIWQYSDLYADTKGGYIYGEAAVVMERMSRELTDAGAVDPTAFPSNGAISTLYISFQPQHGTPADLALGSVPRSQSSPPDTGYWVQYCVCAPAGGRQSLYRVRSVLVPGSNACAACPPTQGALMSTSIKQQSFAVQYNKAAITSDNDSYTITLGLVSNRSAVSNPSVTLVSRVTPRNCVPYDPDSGTGMGTDRSFDGGYYDEIN